MKIKLPRPTDKVYSIKRGGLTFWLAAHSWLHAKRMVRSFSEDMKHSVRLRNAWEITPKNIGLGHAGIEAAKRARKNAIQRSRSA